MNRLPETVTLSIVLPVFNEASNVRELHSRLSATLADLAMSYELLFVDDGSRDGSADLLRELAAEDARVFVLVLSRNFGHQIALTAGLDHARGDAVVLMDSDLQDPPELIPKLVARWREGYDVVLTQRKARPGESAFKRATAYLFYRFLRLISRIDIPADTADFRLLDRRAADALRGMKEKNRFLRGLVAWLGFRQARVLYERPVREKGESKYRLWDMARLAVTGALSFSSVPIALVGAAGCAVGLGAVIGFGLGVSPVASALFFLGGVQLLGLWVVGRYVVLIAEEVRGRPLYLVREKVQSASLARAPAEEPQSVTPARQA